MPISRSLNRRIQVLPRMPIANYPDPVVPDFAVIFDIHQDSPGRTQFFYPPRGFCLAVKVALDPVQGLLVSENGGTVPIDERAKFMTVQQWTTWVMNYIIETGRSPMYPNGTLPTHLVRDARKGVNLFRSFRQMTAHAAKRGGGTIAQP